MRYNKRMKDIRIDADRTQTEAAEFLGIDQSYYAKYENGIRPLPIHRLLNFCLYFGVSADYILGLPRGLKWPR